MRKILPVILSLFCLQAFSQNSFYFTSPKSTDQHLSACIETQDGIVGIVKETNTNNITSSYLLVLTKDGKFNKELHPFSSPCQLEGIIQLNENYLVFGFIDRGTNPFYWKGDAYAAIISANGQLLKERIFQNTDSTISIFRKSAFRISDNEIYLFGARINHNQLPINSFAYKVDQQLNVLDSSSTSIVNAFYTSSYAHVPNDGFVFGNNSGGIYSIGYDLKYRYEGSIPLVTRPVETVYHNGHFYFGGENSIRENDTNFYYHEYVRLDENYNMLRYRRSEPYKSFHRLTRNLIAGQNGQVILIGESFHGEPVYPNTDNEQEIAVYDNQDNLVWSKSFKPAGYHFYYNSIVLSDGGILITGSVEEENKTIRKDIFAMKISKDGALSVPKRDGVDFEVQVYPNPSQGIFRIDAGIEPYEIEVTDIAGRAIKVVLENNTIDLTNEAKGTYFYTIVRNGSTSSGMLLKN